MKHIESNEQQALFEWAKLQENTWPTLKLLHAIPNGGKRDIREAARLKKEGVKAGIPDIFLPVSKKQYEFIYPSDDEPFETIQYCGLYIEMKAGKNKPTKNQLWWHEELKKQGYKVEVCYNWIEASEVIMKYLCLT